MTTRPDQAHVLFFTTPHCSICKTMRPVASDVADRFTGTVQLTEVDSNADPETPSIYRVRGVPTFIAIHDGVEVARAVGSRTPEQLTELFEAAAAGTKMQTRISTTDRTLRLGVAVIFAIAALATSTPILWVFAAGAAGFAMWDLRS